MTGKLIAEMKRKKTAHIDTTSANFRNLVISLSDSVGQHHISVVRDAMHPNALISSEAVHYELVKKIFRDIYRANRCYHLNATVDCHKTFDVLGKIHAELVDSEKTDVDQIGLLQNIGEATRKFFEAHDSCPSNQTPESKDSSVTPFSTVASLIR